MDFAIETFVTSVLFGNQYIQYNMDTSVMACITITLK